MLRKLNILMMMILILGIGGVGFGASPTVGVFRLDPDCSGDEYKAIGSFCVRTSGIRSLCAGDGSTCKRIVSIPEGADCVVQSGASGEGVCSSTLGDIALQAYTVATLPEHVVGKTKVAIVTDGTGQDDCASGGGSILVVCVSDGSNWRASGGVSGPSSSSNGGLVGFDGTDGKKIKAITELPSGTTATTEAAGDSSGKVATTEYVDATKEWSFSGCIINPYEGLTDCTPIQDDVTLSTAAASALGCQTDAGTVVMTFKQCDDSACSVNCANILPEAGTITCDNDSQRSTTYATGSLTKGKWLLSTVGTVTTATKICGLGKGTKE